MNSRKKSDASQSVCHNQSSKQVTTNNAKDSSEASQTESNELLKIISLGRRTIGLYKIDDADLERMRQEQYGGAKSEEEEKMLAVQEYLRCELKIDSDTIGRMEIERIFPPPGGDPKHLFVTFKKESSVTKVLEKTRIMRTGSRILYYVPRQFKYRVKSIREIEFQLRQSKNYQTRIKMGLTDLELWKKVRGSRCRWERVELPSNLPPVDFSIDSDSVTDIQDTLSPPPGRPGQRTEKRDRESTGSENSSCIKSKVSRKNENDTFADALKKADLVGEATISPAKEGEGLKRRLDTGIVLSISGTPSKQSFIQSYPDSPIISNKSSKK